MSQINGYLTDTDSKSGPGKRGPWTVYKGQINGKWYSLGFDRPSVAKGDYVTATVEKDGDYEKLTNVKKADAEPAVSPKTDTLNTGPVVQYRDRNDSIVYQSSRKDAIAILGLLISQDALPISAAKTAAGKAKRYEELLALVDKITVQFFYDVNTLRNLERVQDAGAEGIAPQELPEDDQAVEEDPTAAAAGNW